MATRHTGARGTGYSFRGTESACINNTTARLIDGFIRCFYIRLQQYINIACVFLMHVQHIYHNIILGYVRIHAYLLLVLVYLRYRMFVLVHFVCKSAFMAVL